MNRIIFAFPLLYTFLGNFGFAANPTSTPVASVCMCPWAVGCVTSADCCSGLVCNGNQCQPYDLNYHSSCVISYNGAGCKKTADCCNSYSSCGSDGRCTLPSSSCSNSALTTSLPSTKPISASPITSSKYPTILPTTVTTGKPSSVSTTAKSSLPTLLSTAIPTAKTTPPTIAPTQPSIAPSTTKSTLPTAIPSSPPKLSSSTLSPTSAKPSLLPTTSTAAPSTVSPSAQTTVLPTAISSTSPTTVTKTVVPSAQQSRLPTAISSASPSAATTTVFPSALQTRLPTPVSSLSPTVIGTTVVPSASPKLSSSSPPTAVSINSYSYAPTPSSSSCLCQYATGCSATSPCCPGLTCNYLQGYSQCLADPSLVTGSCLTTYQPCTSSSQCCPGRICSTSNQCDFPCEAKSNGNNNNNQPTQPTGGSPQCNNPVPSGAVTGPVGPISRKGNQFIDKDGNTIRISGVNWTGFEGYENRPDGLHKRNYKDIISEVQALGFNAFRFPFSNSMLRNNTAIWIDYYQNPDLKGKTPIQIMDIILTYCNSVGMAFVLDRHSVLQTDYPNEHFWYLPGDSFYTEKQVIADLVMLAKRYIDLPYFIGIDLWNEPKTDCVWADWACAAGRFGNAILEANPNLLIIVEGGGFMTWWSGNLQGVAQQPVVISNPSKLVYSVHDYGTCVFNQTWFWTPGYPGDLYNHWNTYWGYLLTAPEPSTVLIGELGCPMTYYKDLQWIDMFTRYLNGDFDLNGGNELKSGDQGVSWLYWNLSPGADTGGIYENDWKTIDKNKMDTINGNKFGTKQNIFGKGKLF